MSFNGSGVFTINTAGQPVITGTTISSTTFNSLTADLATGLTTALTKDGQSTPTANIGMGAFKITNLAAGTVASDAARLDQVQGGAATFITVTGTDTLTGTVVPALSAYATGNQFSFLVANTNTGAVTINVDGIGTKAITRTGTTALVAGDMVAGQAVEIIYDGTRFQLVNGNSFTNLKVSGTLGVTGVATFTAQPIVSSLTASLPVFTDASDGLVSNTMTGTGNVVMSTSPTLVTPALGTPSALVGTNITGTAAGLTAGTVTTNANLTGMVTSVGNAASLGSFTSAQLATALTDETGTGANVFATSPTLVTPVLGAATATTLAVSGSINTPNTFGFKNRIINGGMVIDQRNAGASVTQTTSTVYVTDRFCIRGSVASKFTGQQSSTAPQGFVNSLLCTSSSAYSVGAAEAFFTAQFIEGNNVADLGWGTANAATVTLSFWVRSSLTGTFGGAISNYAGTRSYPFTYTIIAANTWEQKSVTITGDTSGTWVTDNNGSVAIQFGLGVGSTLSGTANAWAGALYRSATGATSVVGTNGATFYITGVQLEKGSTATSFDFRAYSTELAMCQRYYFRTTPVAGDRYASGFNSSTIQGKFMSYYPVPMRIAPAAMETSGTATDYSIEIASSAITANAVPSLNNNTINSASFQIAVASGLTANGGSFARSVTTNGYLGWSAEL